MQMMMFRVKIATLSSVEGRPWSRCMAIALCAIGK